MGNEVSKPREAVEPPPEWDPSSNRKRFELVSPMSDLSDPSMFLHRRPHPNVNDATVQQNTRKQQQPHPVAMGPHAKVATGPETRGNTMAQARQQTSAGDRRRRSKVIATRDSAYKHQSRPREMPPPSSFYFPEVPTKDSEAKLNRLSVRLSSSTGARRLSTESENINKVSKPEEEEEDKENNADSKPTPMLLKARRKVYKARACLTGCFEDSGQKLQLMRDNARPSVHRGELLSSEAGIESNAERLKESEKNTKLFDPYQQDTLPKAAKAKSTVLQFVDGNERELAFNPVWRESYDGTLHDTSTATASRRDSSISNFIKEGRGSVRGDSSDKSLRNSIGSREGTGPPSDVVKPSVSEKNSVDPNKEDSESTSPFDEIHGVINDRKSTETNVSQSRRDSKVDPSSRRESVVSVATSHESSYWNGFYNDTRVLHHEDAYFDRIAFVPRESSIPEPSPMANEVATPVADLFGQGKNLKSLLGLVAAREDSMEDELHDVLALVQAAEETWCATPKGGKASDEADLVPDALSKETGNKGHHLKSVDLEECGQDDRAGETNTPEVSSSGHHQNTSPLNKDQAASMTERQLGDGTVAITRHQIETKRPTAAIEYNRFDAMSKPSENAYQKLGRESFLDRRISADTVLVQTAFVSDMATKAAPQRHSVDLIHGTPQASMVQPRSSFGSAYSYRDKDVFTPVTSLATFPKGSPFRPRVNAAEKAMAKAKLDHPTMFTQSFDNTSRGNHDMMEIHASESAPSMIESHDYRDIALGCFLEDTPSTAAIKKDRVLALVSPGLMSPESPMSTSMSPVQSLLSNQVISNAAFLFSPSYASGSSFQETSELATGKNLTKRERAVSISTGSVQSRSLTFSRSKHPVRIPGCSSTVLSLTSSKITSRRSIMSDTSSQNQKSVRFSDAHSVAASQKSRRSVTWDFSFKPAPENVDIPAIETKVSDLSDTMFGRESLDSIEKGRASYASSKPLRRSSTVEEEISSVPSSDEPSRPSLCATIESCEYSSASRPSLASSVVSQEFSKDSRSSTSFGTPEQKTRWTYCENSKGVTPLLDKKQLANATDSPMLRFKAAKNKFVSKHEKEIPVKRKSTCAYKRTAGNGRVHRLAAKFDHGPALEPKAFPAISARRSYGDGISQHDERLTLRTPQIMGYMAKSYPNSFHRASLSSEERRMSNTRPREPFLEPPTIPELPINEVPDDASCDLSQRSSESDESSYVQSVATVRQEGREERHNIVTGKKETEADRFDEMLDEILEPDARRTSQSDGANNRSPEREDLPCDEAEDDFAELLLDNLLGENVSSREDEATVVTMTRQSSNCSIRQLRSVISEDVSEGENSTFTNIMAAPTFSDESTSMSSLLAQQTSANLRYGARTVQPQVQSQTIPTNQSLFLSPLQRTPIEASKWRELAMRAQKQDTSKNNIFRSGKQTKKHGNKGLRARLSERDQNIA